MYKMIEEIEKTRGLYILSNFKDKFMKSIWKHLSK